MLTTAEAPTPIDGLASAASVILIIELSLIILLLAVLMLLLAFSLKWVHDHVIPPLQQIAPAMRGAMGATDRATGRVVDFVSTLYARRKGVEGGVRSFVDTLLPMVEYIFSKEPAHHNGATSHAADGQHSARQQQPGATTPHPSANAAPTAVQFDPLGDTIVMRRQPRPTDPADAPTQPLPPPDETGA